VVSTGKTKMKIGKKKRMKRKEKQKLLQIYIPCVDSQSVKL